MGKSTKAQSAPWKNTAGKREGMYSGSAPAPGAKGSSDPSRGKVHDAGYGYASFAKSSPATHGQGKGMGKK
jgi:hypothetical protein